jgi:UDP:flavonoid glycosyltransferase YjiC (YdhE family)
LISILLNNFQVINAGNILAIYPTASYSHQVVFRAHTKAMLARGHHLTVITTDVMESNNPNLTQIDLHELYDAFRSSLNFVDFKESGGSMTELMEWFIGHTELITQIGFQNPQIQKLLQKTDNIKFDLVIVELLSYYGWHLFAPLYDAPLIGFTSLDTMVDNHEYLGNAINPIIHPEIGFSYLPPLNFRQRYESLKYFLYNKLFYKPRYDRIFERIAKKYLPELEITAEEMRGSVQLVLMNCHPVLGYIRPIVPTTIPLGFLHIEPAKPLPSDLQNFLDSSKKGVIYMSLGSNVRSADLSQENREVFLQTFQSLTDYDILWKFEDDSMENQPKNVKISKWLPQSDLLSHPKIKCFITQGGQQSLEEAIDRTIPMIVIPFLGDQDSNARRLFQRNVAIYLNLATLTREKLEESITEIMKPTYKKNIQHLRELIHDQPMTSLEKSVWWTEYVMRHKTTKHLEYVGTKIPFYQKYFLDFIGVGIIAVLVVLKILILLHNIIHEKIFGIPMKQKTE